MEPFEFIEIIGFIGFFDDFEEIDNLELIAPTLCIRVIHWNSALLTLGL